MQKNYVIRYKLNGKEHQEPVTYGSDEMHPMNDLTAYQIVTLKHGGLEKGEPVHSDFYKQAEELGISDLRVEES